MSDETKKQPSKKAASKPKKIQISDADEVVAEEKLSNEGRYPLHSEDFLTSMDGVNFDA